MDECAVWWVGFSFVGVCADVRKVGTITGGARSAIHDIKYVPGQLKQVSDWHRQAREWVGELRVVSVVSRDLPV